MAKCGAMMLAWAVCLVSVVSVGHSEKDKFVVEGRVYCDTCRIQFFTRVSKYIEGAKVVFECRDREEGGTVTFSREGVTDKTGTYNVEVDGDHEEEICEVRLVKSEQAECSEIPTDGYGHRARVSVTGNNGITNPVRNANPLGFMRKEALPDCKEVLRELGFDEAGLPV